MTIALRKLAPWTARTPDEVGLDPYRASDGVMHWDELLGRPPDQVREHVGDVHAEGNVRLDGWKAHDQGQTAYVIRGDLAVDGVLHAEQYVNTLVMVTGTLTTHRLVCAASAQLLVLGDVIVRDLAVTRLDDSGHLVVRQRFSAPAWIDLTFRGNVALRLRPRVRFLSDDHAEQTRQLKGRDRHWARYHLAAEPASPAVLRVLRDGDEIDRNKLMRAAIGGKPVLG